MTTRRLPACSAPPFVLGQVTDEEWEQILASRAKWAQTVALRTRLSGDDPRPADGASPPGVSAAPASTPTARDAAGVGVTPGCGS